MTFIAFAAATVSVLVGFVVVLVDKSAVVLPYACMLMSMESSGTKRPG